MHTNYLSILKELLLLGNEDLTLEWTLSWSDGTDPLTLINSEFGTFICPYITSYNWSVHVCMCIYVLFSLFMHSGTISHRKIMFLARHFYATTLSNLLTFSYILFFANFFSHLCVFFSLLFAFKTSRSFIFFWSRNEKNWICEKSVYWQKLGVS